MEKKSKLLKILERFERRYGYWPMDSETWIKAVNKYGNDHRQFQAARFGTKMFWNGK